jgi:hypothetical protein
MIEQSKIQNRNASGQRDQMIVSSEQKAVSSKTRSETDAQKSHHLYRPARYCLSSYWLPPPEIKLAAFLTLKSFFLSLSRGSCRLSIAEFWLPAPCAGKTEGE